MNRCPSDGELVEYCVSSNRSTALAGKVGQHVQGCARCQREMAALRQAAHLLRKKEAERPGPASACLDDLTIAALAEGGLDSTARQPTMDHLLACGHCRQRVVDVSRILEDEGVAAEIRTLQAVPDRSGRRSRWLHVGGGLAAAAVVVLVVRTAGAPRGTDLLHREESVTLISAPEPVQPIGIVARVDSLSWRNVSRASQYRVILFSWDGATVWDIGTSDTVVVLPATVRLVPGASYFWKVEARTDWNRWTASEMVEIRIRRGP